MHILDKFMVEQILELNRQTGKKGQLGFDLAVAWGNRKDEVKKLEAELKKSHDFIKDISGMLDIHAGRTNHTVIVAATQLKNWIKRNIGDKDEHPKCKN